MLHPLREARQRGVPIVTLNPLRERGLISFQNPQSPAEMLTGDETRISTQYHQLKIGGDMAAMMGIAKSLIERGGVPAPSGRSPVPDMEFINEHCHGYEAFADAVRATAWADIERESGLRAADLHAAADVFAAARAVIAVYGMGLTQHREGVRTVQMLSNLLLLGGHVGRPGAGICPVRGHSNVQGQRTVGITEKPEQAPLDVLARQYAFEPPRDKGLNTVETCREVIGGRLRAFIGLGGNFVRAVPETEAVEAAWGGLALTVQIATKLNRSHLVHGQAAYLLPCLGRIEIDRQASGEQTVSVEDSTGVIHASQGAAEPAGDELLSEIDIVARLALATLPGLPQIPWRDWVADYARIRDAIAISLPEVFRDYDTRLAKPGGFPKPNAARQRQWKTVSGKATFITPRSLVADPDTPQGPGVWRLTTLRSDDQFNTSIYSLDDRLRGVFGTRLVLLANAQDMAAHGWPDGCIVSAECAIDDGVHRRVDGLRITYYDIPQDCLAGYFPECNPLLPLSQRAERSFVPAAKSIPVRLYRTDAAPSGTQTGG